MQARNFFVALEQFSLPESQTGKQHPFVTITNCYVCLKDLHKLHHTQAMDSATKSCNWHRKMTLYARHQLCCPAYHMFIKILIPRVYSLQHASAGRKM